MSHVSVTRKCNVKDRDAVSVLANDDDGMFLDHTGEDIERRRDDYIDDMVDSASSTLVVLLA